MVCLMGQNITWFDQVGSKPNSQTPWLHMVGSGSIHSTVTIVITILILSAWRRPSRGVFISCIHECSTLYMTSHNATTRHFSAHNFCSYNGMICPFSLWSSTVCVRGALSCCSSDCTAGQSFKLACCLACSTHPFTWTSTTGGLLLSIGQ